MGQVLVAGLERVGGVRVTWAPHFKFASECCSEQASGVSQALLSGMDLLLVDAFDRDQTQDQPTRSALRCLDVLEVVGDLPVEHRPVVVAYSTAMRSPALRATMHSTGVVAATYTPPDLLEHLAEVLAGRYPGAVDPPSLEDWRSVHPAVRPGADLARLHRCMEANERAWRIVVDPGAPFDQAAQKWITRHILPWLTDAEHPSYRVAVDITRKIAGFSP